MSLKWLPLLIVPALLAIACGGDGSSPTPTPTPAPTAAASPTAIATPVAGAPAEVQAIVDAALSGDAEALRPLLGYAAVPCGPPVRMLGGPPLCREGEADGTPVDVFTTAACEGGYLRPDEIDRTLDTLSDIDFYAVYRWPEEFNTPFFAYEYAAIFSRTFEGEGRVVGLMINEGKLVHVAFGCFQTPEQFVEARQLEDVVVAPEATDVNCRLLLLAPGCAAEVTIVEPSRLNVRASPGTGQVIIGKLAENDIVCLLGFPAIKDNIRWWRLRTTEGTEGWAAAFDPEGPAEPWLTATGRTCQEEQLE